MHNLIYQYDNFEDEYENEGMAYGRQRRFTNSNLNKESEFSTPNRRGRFPYTNHDRKKVYPSSNKYMMKVDIPSFSENFGIESLNWIYEVDKFFEMAYVPMKKQAKFVTYKLKGGAAA